MTAYAIQESEPYDTRAAQATEENTSRALLRKITRRKRALLTSIQQAEVELNLLAKAHKEYVIGERAALLELHKKFQTTPPDYEDEEEMAKAFGAYKLPALLEPVIELGLLGVEQHQIHLIREIGGLTPVDIELLEAKAQLEIDRRIAERWSEDILTESALASCRMQLSETSKRTDADAKQARASLDKTLVGIDKQMTQVAQETQAILKRDSEERTGLHLAAGSGDREDALHLLDIGADPNARESSGNTPLQLICRINGQADAPARLAIAERLIEKHVDVNSRNCNGYTALHIAAQLCDLEILNVLIAKGGQVDVGSYSAPFQTPLFTACVWTELYPPYEERPEDYSTFSLMSELEKERQAKLVQLLLSASKDPIHEYVLDVAVQYDCRHLIPVLLKHGQDPSTLATSLADLCEEKGRPEIALLIAEFQAQEKPE